MASWMPLLVLMMLTMLELAHNKTCTKEIIHTYNILKFDTTIQKYFPGVKTEKSLVEFCCEGYREILRYRTGPICELKSSIELGNTSRTMTPTAADTSEISKYSVQTTESLKPSLSTTVFEPKSSVGLEVTSKTMTPISADTSEISKYSVQTTESLKPSVSTIVFEPKSSVGLEVTSKTTTPIAAGTSEFSKQSAQTTESFKPSLSTIVFEPKSSVGLEVISKTMTPISADTSEFSKQSVQTTDSLKPSLSTNILELSPSTHSYYETENFDMLSTITTESPGALLNKTNISHRNGTIARCGDNVDCSSGESLIQVNLVIILTLSIVEVLSVCSSNIE